MKYGLKWGEHQEIRPKQVKNLCERWRRMYIELSVGKCAILDFKKKVPIKQELVL